MRPLEYAIAATKPSLQGGAGPKGRGRPIGKRSFSVWTYPVLAWRRRASPLLSPVQGASCANGSSAGAFGVPARGKKGLADWERRVRWIFLRLAIRGESMGMASLKSGAVGSASRDHGPMLRRRAVVVAPPLAPKRAESEPCLSVRRRRTTKIRKGPVAYRQF